MAEENHIIEPERHGLWLAVTFIIALLALALSVITVIRANIVHDGTQMEVVILNKKIEDLRKEVAKSGAAEQRGASGMK
jgi:hypothetical protein